MTEPHNPSIKATPYWWDDCAFPTLPTVNVDTTCDVAIVGGGYTGLSAALELVRAGQHVQLFDRQALGQAASSRNGGMASGSIRPSRRDLIKRFGQERAAAILLEGKAAREDLWRFLKDEAIDCDFRLTGLFEGAMTADEADSLRRDADLLHQTLGIEAYAVERTDVERFIGTELYIGGLVRKDIGGLQPAKLLSAMIALVLKSDVKVHEQTPVFGFEAQAGGVRIRTERGEVTAKKLLVCTNAYTDGFDPWLRRRLVPVRSRIIATEPLGREVMDRLMPTRMMYGDLRKLSYYYRPSHDGSRILFGGRDGTVEGNPAAPTAHVQTELARLFPELSGVGLTHSWFGSVAMHRDMIPRVFSRGNVLYATGYCGSGVVWARWLGKKAAAKLLGKADSERSAFDSDPAPKAIPFFSGKPWFIPLVYALYGRHDRKRLRRRAKIRGDR